MAGIQQGRVRRFLLYHFRKKGGTILLGLLFLAGAFVGTKIYGQCDSETVELLAALMGLQRNTTFSEAFQNGFLTEGGLMVLLFFCGFCAIGQPVAAFLLFYRGLGLGIAGTFLAQQGREAFSYYALILLPQTLLFLLLQLAATRESIAFSLNFLRQLFGSAGVKGLSVTPRVYVLRFLFLLLLSGFSAFLGALLMLLISRWIL